MNYFYFFILFTACIGILLLASYIFYKYIYTAYKYKSIRMSFDDAWATLGLVVKSEIEMYEHNVFEKKKAITNANFENFYKDLSNRIIKHISPILMNSLCIYITEDAVYRYIARTVQTYLAQYAKDLI